MKCGGSFFFFFFLGGGGGGGVARHTRYKRLQGGAVYPVMSSSEKWHDWIKLQVTLNDVTQQRFMKFLLLNFSVPCIISPYFSAPMKPCFVLCRSAGLHLSRRTARREGQNCKNLNI